MSDKQEVETVETMGNLPMVRCKTCNRPIGNIYKKFIHERKIFEEQDQGDSYETPSFKAFEKLNITNQCCRYNLENPPRIPIGAYYYEPTNIPNTYIIGEHGVNRGDPEVLKFLNTNAVEDSKKSLVSSGIFPIYRRVVPTSNIRYGRRYTPVLRDLCGSLIELKINMSNEDSRAVDLALWELFLGSMYLRGWKGPGYGYPVSGTGKKLPRLLNDLLDQFIDLTSRGSVAGWYNANTMEKEMKTYGLTIPRTFKQLINSEISGTPEIAEEYKKIKLTVESIISDIRDIDGASVHEALFMEYYRSSNTVTQLIDKIRVINYYMGEPIQMDYSLKKLRNESTNTMNYSRLIALTAYYMLDILTGQHIANFDPKLITGDESGVIFPEIHVPFVEFKTEK